MLGRLSVLKENSQFQTFHEGFSWAFVNIKPMKKSFTRISYLLKDFSKSLQLFFKSTIYSMAFTQSEKLFFLEKYKNQKIIIDSNNYEINYNKNQSKLIKKNIFHSSFLQFNLKIFVIKLSDRNRIEFFLFNKID